MKGGIGERYSFSLEECLYLPVYRKVESGGIL